MQHALDRLGDWLLTTDRVQRVRLSQAGLAMLLMTASVLAMFYLPAAGFAPLPWVALWALVSLAGLAGFFWLVRSGWSQRFADPSLTLAQMLYAIACAAGAYALAGPARGAVFPILMVILMFGMFQLDTRRVAAATAYALAVFGVVMALMAWREPEVFAPRAELAHFLMICIMLPAVTLLASRLSRMRQRLQRQKDELASALARNQQLATRDELTGLVNQRHILELLEQERQRCVRSGRTYCVALIEIEHFDRIAARHGHQTADAALQQVAREAQAATRSADVLARWDGAQFVLLLSDTRAPLARSGLERLRERVAAATVPLPGEQLKVCVLAGLTEHIAGQRIPQALERADAALHEARSHGGCRVVMR